MSKGFGIAALVVALIALFVPFVGIVVSAVAVILAIAAVLQGDRTFATAVSVIAFVNTFVLSPINWRLITTPGIAGPLVGAVFAIVCGAPLAAIFLLNLRNRPDVYRDAPSPFIAREPKPRPVNEPKPRPVNREVPKDIPARESPLFRGGIWEKEAAGTNSQVSPPQEIRDALGNIRYDLGSNLATFLSNIHLKNPFGTSKNYLTRASESKGSGNVRRLLVYTLRCALLVAVLLFVPETRALIARGAIDFGNLLSDRHPDVSETPSPPASETPISSAPEPDTSIVGRIAARYGASSDWCFSGGSVIMAGNCDPGYPHVSVRVNDHTLRIILAEPSRVTAPGAFPPDYLGAAGSLLFEGTSDDQKITGIFWRKVKGCNPVRYDVSGSFSENNSIQLVGRPPRMKGCQNIGSYNPTLHFFGPME